MKLRCRYAFLGSADRWLLSLLAFAEVRPVAAKQDVTLRLFSATDRYLQFCKIFSILRSCFVKSFNECLVGKPDFFYQKYCYECRHIHKHTKRGF